MNTQQWQAVIGLEVHAQVNTKSKLFSSAATQFGSDCNTQVSLFDAALPGTLPVLNKECVKQTVRTGLALHGHINTYSVFDRKNYFYPDLPAGYQISQFFHPIVTNGKLVINTAGTQRCIHIERIHLEQDAGKSLHDYSPNHTYIDLNRAGIALMEIVTAPELTSPEEAGEFVKQLRLLLRFINTCDGNMEEGSLRCDANVSVKRRNDVKLGTRCEIKNLNSIRYIVQAVDYEINRQIAILENNGIVAQETRLFNVNTNQTKTMRKKEDSHDYRYFPDPDLIPLRLSEEFIQDIAVTLPELPEQKKQRYCRDMGLSTYEAEVLTTDRDTSNYFEVLTKKHDPKLTANWILSELFAHLNKANLSIAQSSVKPNDLSELLELITKKEISQRTAKQVLTIMFNTKKSASEIIDEMNLRQITDVAYLSSIIEEVLQTNTAKVTEYLTGKHKILTFFVGQVMKKTNGRADPAIVNKLLSEQLSRH